MPTTSATHRQSCVVERRLATHSERWSRAAFRTDAARTTDAGCCTRYVGMNRLVRGRRVRPRAARRSGGGRARPATLRPASRTRVVASTSRCNGAPWIDARGAFERATLLGWSSIRRRPPRASPSGARRRGRLRARCVELARDDERERLAEPRLVRRGWPACPVKKPGGGGSRRRPGTCTRARNAA